MTHEPLDEKCPQCDRPIGDHTIREWPKCLDAAGKNYTMPYQEIPGGPLMLDGEQIMVGEITVACATIDAPIGKVPALVFTFAAPGLTPMSSVPTPTYVLVGDERMMLAVKDTVAANVDGVLKAIG